MLAEDTFEQEGTFEELVEECYICMMPCETKSPCKCQTVVHPACLEEYRTKSGHDECTICLGKYPQIVPSSPLKYIATLFFYIILYLVCGILGQLVLAFIKHIQFSLRPPWSVTFLVSSLCICSIGAIITHTVKKYSV